MNSVQIGRLVSSLNLDKEILDRIIAFINFDQSCSESLSVFELLRNQDEIAFVELFGSCLDFGTSGIRALLGAGLSRINAFTVVQISLSFYQYLKEKCFKKLRSTGIAISYDGRTKSRHFAELAGAVFMSKGIKVFIYPLCPTPLLAFIVKNYSYCAGVMITASHNPKEYNGYKVYIEGGCQIASPDDRLMKEKMIKNRFLDFKTIYQWNLIVYMNNLNICPVETVMTDYCAKLKQIYHFCPKVISEMKKSNSLLKITFTALHGVSSSLMRKAIEIFNLNELIEVVEQAEPDPDFPTVKFPNPEESSALQLAVTVADQNQSELIISTDPDGDRLAIIEKKNGKWKIFNGNEIATILGHLAFKLYKDNVSHKGKSIDSAYMLFTTVSSKILKTIAKEEGFNCIETPPGFKYIGNKIKEIHEEHEGNLIFGFEESLGYMMGDEITREKDGISTGILICLLANQLYYQNSGRWPQSLDITNKSDEKNVELCVNSKNVSKENINNTTDQIESKSSCQPYTNYKLQDHLNDIFRTYGYHQCITSYFSFGKDDTIVSKIFERVINSGNYYLTIGSHKVTGVRDLTGLVQSQPVDSSGHCDMPISKISPMITYSIDDDTTLTIRRSGTERKIKYYIEVIGKTDNPEQLLAKSKQIERDIVFDILFKPFLSELEWKGEDAF